MKHLKFALVLGVFTLTAIPAQAATAYPKITAEDLAACKNEIAELHRLEINLLKKEARLDCAKSQKDPYNADNCKLSNKWVSESATKSHLSWYMKGNESCQMSDYPCYGVSTYNTAEPNVDLIRTIAKMETNNSDNAYDYSFVVDKCVAKLWLAKLDNSKAASPANSTENHYEGETLNGKKHGRGVYTWANGDRFVGEFRDDKLYSGKTIKPSGEVIAVFVNGVLTEAPKRESAGNTGGNRTARATPAGIPEREPRPTTGSTGNPGASNSNTQSTERTQAAGTNRTPPTSADSRSSSKKEKRQHVPDAVASKCLSLNTTPGSFGGFVNSCPYAVFYTYCAEHPKKGAWTEAFDCDKRYSLGSDVVGANKTSGAHTKGAKNIHWVACKYREPDGTYAGISVKDVKWDAQKRMLTFRCSE